MIETRVVSIVSETPDCSTFHLQVTGAPFTYKAGQAISIDPAQFATLHPHLKRSSYYSIASAPTPEGWFEITVKAGSDSSLSRHLLDQIRRGDTIRLDGPFGRYTLPSPLPSGIRGTIHLCAGSGVVPSRAILQEAIRSTPALKHILFLQSRSLADVIYKREWNSLRDRVKVVHVLSRAEPHWKGHRGYVTPHLLREELSGWLDLDHALAFVCGPNHPRVVEGVRHPGFVERFAGRRKDLHPGILTELGLPFDRIITEGG